MALETRIAAGGDEVRRAARVAATKQRWHRLDVLSSGLSNLTRVRNCRRWRRPDRTHVLIRSDGAGSAFTGLQTCGSPWACPVCSAAIRQGRAVELEAAAAAHLANGGGLTFVTLTLRHNRGQSLESVLGSLRAAWRDLQWSPEWREELRPQMLGFVRAVEVTYGVHGWHPHMHLLLFTRRPMSRPATRRVGARLFRLWRDSCAALGVDAVRQAFDVQPVRAAAGISGYISKTQDGKSVALELARADLKAGRGAYSLAPFELVDLADRFGGTYAALWREFERATKGLSSLRFSRGLRAALLLPEAATDAALADSECALAPVVAAVTADEWRTLVARYRDRRAALLIAAATGGQRRVDSLLGRWKLSSRRATPLVPAGP